MVCCLLPFVQPALLPSTTRPHNNLTNYPCLAITYSFRKSYIKHPGIAEKPQTINNKPQTIYNAFIK
jgi:hypothetical protein